MFFHKNKRQIRSCSKRTTFCALFLFIILSTSVLVTFFLNANAQLVPIRSVEITSEHTNYENSNPGAWKVTKSAEWTDVGKAKITFEVNSISKYQEGKKYDVIMVIDNSGSMSGDKMNQVKIDASDLVDSLLDDPNNQVALVTFESTAHILSGFTNDKSEILNYINDITTADCTNYYDGLLKAADVLEGYTRQDNRDLILLFLTDGYPNERTPNEVAEYHALKTAYPYLVVNGIQYEMGDTVLQPIIDISDNQFIADMSSLNNVLFEATIIPRTYDDFIITDYIDDTYWTVAGLEAVSATLGEIGLTYDDTTPVITWDMSGLYRSGNTATLTIEVNLKNEFLGQEDLLLPTNIHETIESELEDAPDEDTDSDDTPILKKVYDVIYDANAPSDCEVSGTVPATTTHTVFTPVAFSEDTLTCAGYDFAGWKTSNYGISWINDDYFRMPEEDVYIYALWAKPSIAKSMDGTAHERAFAMLDTGRQFNAKLKVLSGQNNAHSDTSNDTITAIIRSYELPQSIDTSNEANILSSSDSPLPIYGWFNNGTIYYYTDADDPYLNPNSEYAFYYLKSLENISGLATVRADRAISMYELFAYAGVTNFDDIKYWNTSGVENMSCLLLGTSLTNLDSFALWDVSNVKTFRNTFANMKLLEDISGIKNWNTSSATSMYGIFEGTYALTNIDDLINWKTGNVTDMGYMFRGSGITNIDGAINWDTSSVTTVWNMLSGSKITNIDGAINWNLSSVTEMSSMLRSLKYLTNIDGAINWNTSSVEDMEYMFDGSTALTNIDGALNWNTGNVTNMWRMFAGASALENIDGARLWNTGKVTDMMYMFYQAKSLKNIDGAGGCFTNDQGEKECVAHEDGTYGWDVSKVTYMGTMFSGAEKLENIDGAINWDTSSVTGMSSMFNFAKSLTNIDGAINWDTSSVTGMSSMFASNYKLENIDGALNWNTGNVTTMNKMFTDNYALTNIDGARLWNTSSVTDMSEMFFFSKSLVNLDGVGGCFTNDQGEKECVAHEDGTYGWDTSNVTTMKSMFANNNALENVDGVTNWNVEKVTNMSSMFTNDKLIEDYNAFHAWNPKNATDISFMFCNNYLLTDLDAFENWNIGNVKNMSSMFSGTKNLANIDGASNWDTKNVTNMENLFSGTNALENIDGALNWNTSNVTSIKGMFHSSKGLKNIDGARLWDTSKVIYVNNLFSESTIENIDGAGGCFTNDQGEKECVAHEDGTYGWDTSSVTDMSDMFWKATKLTNVNGAAHWNTENVTNMSCLFYTTSNLTDISGLANWNTENVTGMTYMFYASGITNVDALSSWNTENVSEMGGMFWNASHLKNVDGLSNWNTDNITTLFNMFKSATELEDISGIEGWNTSNVTSMSGMFYNARSVISFEPIFNWNVDSLTNIQDMFLTASSAPRPDWYYTILNNQNN